MKMEGFKMRLLANGILPRRFFAIKSNGNTFSSFSSSIDNTESGNPSTNPNHLDPKFVLLKIEETVKTNPIVLFMKGRPDAPACGFSRTVCNILDKEGIEDYAAVDVLQNPIVREQIKLYSKWPTIPQLFIKGEFVGGADIVQEMHENGQLAKLIENEKNDN